MAFLCFQRDCFALDPWENSPEVRAQAQAEGWESCAIALVLGSAHMGRRCCGDVEVVAVRPQKDEEEEENCSERITPQSGKNLRCLHRGPIQT